jgi:hypothetical protein
MSWQRNQEEQQKDRDNRVKRADEMYPRNLYPFRNALCRGFSPLHGLMLMDPSGAHTGLFLRAVEKSPRETWVRMYEAVNSECPEMDVPGVVIAALRAFVGDVGVGLEGSNVEGWKVEERRAS